MQFEVSQAIKHDFQPCRLCDRSSLLHPSLQLHLKQIHSLTLTFKLSLLFASLSRLKPLDIEFMKRLHEKVNIIPLIAKADTMTPEECQLFKKQVCDQFAIVTTRVGAVSGFASQAWCTS